MTTPAERKPPTLVVDVAEIGLLAYLTLVILVEIIDPILTVFR